MDPYNLPYNLRDAVLCLSFLIGAGAGIMAITRQHRTTGILMLAGFLMLAIDPIIEVIIFRVLWMNYAGENYDIFNWAYVCISTPATIIGLGCLTAAIFTAIRTKTTNVDNSPIEIPNS